MTAPDATTPRNGPSAAEIAGMLAGRIEALVRDLLPHGRREGHEWKVGSVDGEPGRSLSVHLVGQRAGVWADFSSADQKGDALDLVAAVLRLDTAGALTWARAWLGLGQGAPSAPRRPAPPPKPAAEAEDRETAERRQHAKGLWLAARPRLAGTPVAAYLLGRGIDLAELGRQPRALRFHPELYNRESGRHWPAMVAAVMNGAGEHVATHRTWLARASAGGWGKAPLRDAKMSLGAVRGGAIPLWRGASGKSLRDAPEGDTVALAEGIETALSVAIACPELRVLAGVSVSNMGNLVLPPAIGTVVLCADNDAPDSSAARALQRAADRYLAEGRRVRIARSPVGKDFNDALRDVTA